MIDDIEKLIAVEQRSKSNTHRIDAMEENQKAIQDMAASIRELAVEMRNMKEDQSEIFDRLANIERKPADRLNTIATAIISAVAGALIGMILSGIG